MVKGSGGAGTDSWFCGVALDCIAPSPPSPPSPPPPSFPAPPHAVSAISKTAGKVKWKTSRRIVLTGHPLFKTPRSRTVPARPFSLLTRRFFQSRNQDRRLRREKPDQGVMTGSSEPLASPSSIQSSASVLFMTFLYPAKSLIRKSVVILDKPAEHRMFMSISISA
jgi:hypothetical protein